MDSIAIKEAIENNKICLVRVKNSFQAEDRDIAFIEHNGESLLEIRNKYFPSDVDVVVCLNKEILSNDDLAIAIPIKDDVVTFTAKMGNDVIRIIVGVILVIIGILLYVYVPVIGQVLGTILIGAGVGLIIGGVIGLLFPAKRPILPGTGQDYDASQAYGWSPATVQQQGLAIPRVYGLNKLYGNIIAANLENINDKQYINSLICFGMGPVSRLYDFKLNDQPYENFKGVKIYVRYGNLNQTAIPNFNNTKIENPLSVKIVNGSPYIYVTNNSNFDGLEVDIAFPSGLWYANDSGGLDAYSVSLRIEISPAGQNNWRTMTYSSVQTPVPATIDRWSLGLWIDAAGVEVWYEYAVGDSDPNSHYEGEPGTGYLGAMVPFWRWTTMNTTNYVTQVLDYITITAAQASTIRRTYFATDFAAGQYDIRVTNLTADQTSSRYGDDMYLSSVREVYYDDFEYPRHALVGIKALATDQLSGSLRFSCMGEGLKVRVYDGAAWSVQYNNNPAWVAYDILTQPVYDNNLNVLRYDGYNPSYIDYAKFKEWADFCDTLVPDGKGGTEKRITFNGVFDTGTSVWDALMQVCRLGRAVPLWTGNKLTLFIDKAASPTQMFSIGNTIIDSFKETFLPESGRAGEVEIDYINADKNYERDVATIINPGIDTDRQATHVQLFGITKPSEAWRTGQYLLSYNQYLQRVIEFSAAADAIACTIGDVIYFQCDVAQWGFGGRIGAAGATTVTLDREVTIEAGKTYVILIRLSDDTRVQKTITNSPGNYTILTISDTFATVPSQYDIYSFGESSKVTKPFRITDIQPTETLQFKINAIEYNETIYNIDNGQPALPTPNYSSLTPYPPVTDILLDELLIRGQDGSINDVIDAYFRRPSDYNYSYAEIWYNNGGGWLYAGAAIDTIFRINNVEINKTYKIAIVTVNYAGAKASIQNAPKAEIYTLGKLDPPSNVTGFAVQAIFDSLEFNWNHIVDTDLWGYEIRVGNDWNTGTVISGAGVGENKHIWRPTITGTLNFWLKAIDTSGIYSTTASQAAIAIQSPQQVSGLSQQVIDNNILIKWSANQGTFPIDYYEIRRGDVYSTAAILGTVKGTFTAIFEIQSGTYKYWITAVDTAGLFGASNSLTASVAQPPDFQLKANWDDDFTGTKTNIIYDSGDDKHYACVNATETWDQHFTNNSNNTIQDFIDDGFTYFMQPMLTTANYEKTFDFGSQIPGTMITVALDRAFPLGTLTITPTISVSANGSSWTDYAGVWQVFANNFRYVKVAIAFSGTGQNIAALNNLNVRLSIKLQNDGGSDTVTDANNGKVVAFTKVFADVDSITVTPKGTTARYGIYDFTDIPNPTQFTAYLFDSGGTKITGDFSWAAKGY